MAIAERWKAEFFNRPGYPIFDHNVYAICGDGDMMEGVSGEAASLAGHLKLSNLCWLYDNNHITIEGKTSLAFSEDVAARFMGYGWNVTRVGDANDLGLISRAIECFHNTHDRPTFIIVDSHIGYGAPNRQDTKEAHGEPLGEEEVRLAKKFYGWPEEAKFLVPDGVRENFAEGIGKRGRELREQWQQLFHSYRKEFPEMACQFERMMHRDLPDGWDKNLPSFPADAKGIATRESSGKVENAIAKNVPWLLGGAADLAPSTKTLLTFEGAGNFEADSYGGRNFHFGIREHAMCSILNGMALSKLRPYGAGFLIFSDYSRPPMRLAAIMEIPVIYIFTHDSIGVGEDGPTHQPIEQIAGLRSVPGFTLIRPCDANEVIEAWKVIMRFRERPAALILTRQAVPTLDRTKYAAASGVAKGAYVLADPPQGPPELILIGTGSEVSLCTSTYEQLTAEGKKVRVVSMPSWDLFEKQSREYRDSVLPPQITKRISVEQASTMGWSQYVGSAGKTIGMTTYGASAPLKDVLKKFGFTPDAVLAAAREMLNK
jgi:transketolase